MRVRRLTITILLAFALAIPASADCTLDGLSWLAGSWTGTSGGVSMEEVWTTPAGGMILGLHRDVRGDWSMFEFLRIAKDDDGITYWASPRGKEPTPFRLTQCGDRRATFENPDHDHPKKIIYWLDDEGRLHARIEGATPEDPTNEWIWEKADQ